MLQNRRSCAKRKKYQRDVNRIVRNFNKNMKEDWLWNGRFTLHQYDAYFWPYEDKSGAMFHVFLELIDNKTGITEYMDFDNYSMEWRVYEWANRCITEYWDVWKENPNPNEQARLEGRTPPPWEY